MWLGNGTSPAKAYTAALSGSHAFAVISSILQVKHISNIPKEEREAFRIKYKFNADIVCNVIMLTETPVLGITKLMKVSKDDGPNNLVVD
jgi:hypothetical protein